MPAGRYRFDGVETEIVLGEGHGLQEAHHVLQDLHVEDELLIRRRQPAFEPPGGVIDEVGATKHSAQVAISVS